MTASALPEYSEAVLRSYSVSELVQLLIRHEDRVPRNVIDECARRGSEMIEPLAELLDKDYYWGDDQTPGEWWLLLHAVMILGLISEARAGELLVACMRRMGKAADETPQEWLSGYWPALFRNKPDSVIPALRSVGEERSVPWFMRVDAIDSVIAAAQSRGPELLDDALAWAASMTFSDDEDFDLRLMAGNTLLDFARPEYRQQLEVLADLQPHIGRCFSRGEIDAVYAAGGESHEWERMNDPWTFYTPEKIEERQREWAEEDARLEAIDDDRDVDFMEPYVREEPKIGRNDPCPCGSGKKYKKCCLK